MVTELTSENRVMEAEFTDAATAAAANASDALEIALEALDDIARAVTRGRPTNMKIMFGERVVAEFPVALTAAAAVAAGIAAVMLTKLTIEIVHED